MSIERLVKRFPNPYQEGKRLTEICRISSNGSVFSIEELVNPISEGREIFYRTETLIGSVDMEIKITFLDGDEDSKNITVTVPADTPRNEVFLIDLRSVTTAGLKEVTSVTPNTSPGTNGDKITLVSLDGNIGKLMAAIGEEYGELLRMQVDTLYPQRFLTSSEGYGLDLHGGDVGVDRRGQEDEKFRPELRAYKTHNKASSDVIIRQMKAFAQTESNPILIDFWAGSWVINHSQLLPNKQSDLLLGLLKGISSYMAECQVSRLETTRTINELQTFLDVLTPVCFYIRATLRLFYGSGTSFEDLFGVDSENGYTNLEGFLFYTWETYEEGESIFWELDLTFEEDFSVNGFVVYTWETDEAGESFLDEFSEDSDEYYV